MSVHIQFDQPESRCYTNLDFVTGRVVLVLPYDAAITAVTVKLEGESRTRLSGPKFPGNERSDKRRYELEAHKVRNKAFRILPCAHRYYSFCTKFLPFFPRLSYKTGARHPRIPSWLDNMCTRLVSRFADIIYRFCQAANSLISSHSTMTANGGTRRQ